MQFWAARSFLFVFVFGLALSASVSLAGVPLSLNVAPSSIDTNDSGTVELTITGLSGSDVVLRLFVDADGDGVIDLEDYAIWADVIEDDLPEWSPNMFDDLDPVTGTVRIEARSFGPMEFPLTAGTFIWRAEDAAGPWSDTATLTVTQATRSQFVAGTVIDSVTTLPVPGAMVVLEPFCDSGAAAMQTHSSMTDESGAFVIEVPALLDCHHRVLLVARPEYLTQILFQPHFVFGGSDTYAGQTLELTPGEEMVTGRAVYESGPRVGQGIPGLPVWAESSEGPPQTTVAFTDENGDFALTLTDGSWRMESPEERLDTRGVVRRDGEIEFTVSGAPVSLADLALPAANAFFEGTLFDDASVPQAGRWVSADQWSSCASGCYRTKTLTRADGSYTLGVVAPAGPDTSEYSISTSNPLPGLVAEGRTCDAISEGQTLGSLDLVHLTPTTFVTGRLADKDGEALENVCVQARGSSSRCTFRRAAAVSGCDGSYALPVLDGQWNLQLQSDDLGGFYRNLDETGVSRTVDVAGAEVEGVDFIIGGWWFDPLVTNLQQPRGRAGSHVKIDGHGFSFDNPPQVFFDATPANLLAFRPDLGTILAEVPAALTPGSYAVTVVNTDLARASDPACFEVMPESYLPSCSFSGTAMSFGLGVADAAVVVLANNGDTFVRSAVTDGDGNYSVDLEAAGDYMLLFVPPQGQLSSWGQYVATCGTTLDHDFTDGWQLVGQVVSEWDGQGIEGATVEATGNGGEYFAYTTTGESGSFALTVPDGGFDVRIVPPPGSRFTAANDVAVEVTSDHDLGQLTMNSGFYLVGTVTDAEGGALPAEVQAFHRNDSSWAGVALTTSCSGQFDVALPLGEYRLDISPMDLDVDGATQVTWVGVAGDSFAAFDFTVFDRAGLQLTGPEPRIRFVNPEFGAQVGQPVELHAENIGGTVVDVLFSDGAGGFVAGESTLVDPGRGSVLTRVPAGAATGEMKLQVDGQSGPSVAYRLLPDAFPVGEHTVSGVVDSPGGPVADAIVAVMWQNTASEDCDDDDGLLVDYSLTDVSGSYGPLTHPGGEMRVVFLGPSSGTLASSFDERISFTDEVIDATLSPGVPVAIRATDGDPTHAAVANVIFATETEVGPGDWRLTDANGDATLYLEPGDHEFELIPQASSRFLEQAWPETVTDPVDYGDRSLVRGVMIGSAVASATDGGGVGGASVEARRDGDPWDFFFESRSSVLGLFHGVVAAGSSFQIDVTAPADDLSDFRESGLTVGTQDQILYPAIQLGSAGFVEGVIMDAESSDPLPEIQVNGLQDEWDQPGESTGWTRSCDDGSYRLKLPVGDHFLRINDGSPNEYVPIWHEGAFCSDEATTVTVTAGDTTTVDAYLEQGAVISGTVTFNGLPLEGVGICATSDTVGGCSFCNAVSDVAGAYSLVVPTAEDYLVEAFAEGMDQLCYDGQWECEDFDPVPAEGGSTTSGIDFEFGCAGGMELLYDLFETGASGWTPSGAWHLESEPNCSPTAKSGTTAFYYGYPSCTFDDGDANSGLLLSPVVSNVPSGATLAYWQRRETDGNCSSADRSRVLLWVNGDGPLEIGEECDTSGVWQARLFDLSSYYSAGDQLQVGFEFDTIDDQGNNFLGWMIDDVRLHACGLLCNDPKDDFDADGVCGVVDNCPETANSDQTDDDGDGLGDACDFCPYDSDNDIDGDGICGDGDNCPGTANSEQLNHDGDAAGDDCDPCALDFDNDGDADGLCADADNCPGTANSDQADSDLDGQGDPCDLDDDDDGLADEADNCPQVPNPMQVDDDGDGGGNVCDPLRLDFAPTASSVPPGYLHADGAAFSAVLGFGWSAPVATRERATPVPAPLSTFAYTQAIRLWKIEMPNGDYTIDVTVGDASFTQGTHRVLANGVTVLDGTTTAGGQFYDSSATVHVTSGVLVLEVGGGTGNTALNVVELTRPDSPPGFVSVNFQPLASDTPAGYVADTGSEYDEEVGHGWNVPRPSRERGLQVPQVLDTFVYSTGAATWELDLAPGFYDVLVTVGDPLWWQGPQRVVVEGTTAVDAVTTAGGEFHAATVTVEVTDGQLTVEVGGAGGLTAINQLTAVPAPVDADEDGVPNETDNCPLQANSGQEDSDGDGPGDPCDVCPNDAADDGDDDGTCGDVDNCPSAANPGQADDDSDGVGDDCDACPSDFDNDGDADGLCADADNCPGTANPEQTDTDLDSQGDLCDLDDDDDGLADEADNCPGTANPEQTDTDLDSQGDPCDLDDDDDGLADESDNCPLVSNPLQVDDDGDGGGNVCDLLRIDFAPTASSVPPGYLHADGATFSSVLGFGWSAPVATRERATPVPAPLSTFAYTQAVRLWKIEMPNGDYTIDVTVGDPLWSQGTQRVLANGVTVLDGVTTTGGQFDEATATVHVTHGVLVLEVGGGTGNTALNVVELTRPDSPPGFVAVNFQPLASNTPDGYVADTGAVYDEEVGHGWNVPRPSRERGQHVPQVLDTFVYSTGVATWEFDLDPGTYEVALTVGDPLWSQGPQRVVVEGTTSVDAVTTTAGAFHEATVTVEVTDGRLTLQVGGGGGNTVLNQVVVRPVELE